MARESLPFDHWTVKYSLGEQVRARMHANGSESLRSLFKRGFYGTCHHMRGQHV